jgi:hypothetical protein
MMLVCTSACSTVHIGVDGYFVGMDAVPGGHHATRLLLVGALAPRPFPVRCRQHLAQSVGCADVCITSSTCDAVCSCCPCGVVSCVVCAQWHQLSTVAGEVGGVARCLCAMQGLGQNLDCPSACQQICYYSVCFIMLPQCGRAASMLQRVGWVCCASRAWAGKLAHLLGQCLRCTDCTQLQ